MLKKLSFNLTNDKNALKTFQKHLMFGLADESDTD
jgi:hypothetical protein